MTATTTSAPDETRTFGTDPVRPHSPGRLMRVVHGIGPAGLLIVLGVAVAALTSTEPIYALGVGALVLLIGLTLRQPAAMPVLAMPGLLLINRLGGPDGLLSVSDFILFVAFWPAILLGARPFSAPMRTVLWASAGYQTILLFTVISNPYAANVIEWWHSWLLVAGALVVGWAVGASGKGSLALGLFVGGAVVVAVATLVKWLIQVTAGNFGPVYLNEPFMMHKNYIGCVLGFAAIVVYARPRWLRWNDLMCQGLFVLFLLGILAAQSRQALIGLAVAVAVVALRPDPHHHRSKTVLLAVAGGALVVSTLVRDQLESGDPHNSANQRLTWFEQAIAIWQQYPWFGAGLRWWYTDRFAVRFQPPNAEFEVLSSAGIVGLTGFLLMVLIILVTLWRVGTRFGTLAFVLVLMRFIQGQFDLFWVAGQVSIPFAIAGVCLGAQAYATRTNQSDDPLPPALALRRRHARTAVAT